MSWRGECILISDRGDFIKAEVRESRLHTDHQMFLAVLREERPQKKLRYIGGRTRWPLVAPTVRPQMEGGVTFSYLKGEV